MSRTAPRVARAARVPRALGRRPVLDGLRGIAVLLVMLMHTGLLPGGDVGVDLFFGLSGFLITTLLCEESERAGTISLRRFYERRARRLLPALLVLLALMAVIGIVCWPLTGWPLQLRSLSTLLFVNNWVVALGHSTDLGAMTPTWSLAQEEQFYLVWPLLLAVLLRRRLRPGVIAMLLAAGAGTALVVSPFVAAHVHAYNDYFDPIDRSAELLVGCAAALIWRHRLLTGLVGRLPELGGRWATPALRSRSANALRPALLALRHLAAWLLALAFARLVLAQQPGPIHRSTYLTALALGVALIVVLLGLEGRGLARLLSWRPLRFVGRISYALYLFHLPIRDVVFHYLPAEPQLVDAGITIAISIAAAALSWYALESRVLAGQRRRAPRAADQPVAARPPVLRPAPAPRMGSFRWGTSWPSL